MNLFDQLNGTILRGLAVFGSLSIAVLLLMLLNWIAIHIFGFKSDVILDAMVAISVLMFAGGAGAKYASTHEVSKKE